MLNIRPERSFTAYSRGAELTRAIREMWKANRGATNAVINARIDAIVREYDLTLDEWHHWARALASRVNG